MSGSVRVTGSADSAHERASPAVSPWLFEAAAPAPPLRGDVDADAVVVGGGYTGLSTALALRAEEIGRAHV